jgi:hypothetical protein
MRAFIPLLATTFLLTPVIGSGGTKASSFDDDQPQSEAENVARIQLVQLAAETAKPAAVPPVRVQVQVGTQQRRLGGSYRKQMEINPRIVIEGVNKGVPIPELEAVLIIVTMDTRAKYVERREVFKVESAQTISIPAAGHGSRREIPFEQSVVTFDAWRDHTNVGGATYKYFVFGLRDPQTKTLIDFQTNNPPLTAIAKSSPNRREEFLEFKKGANFPAVIK